MSQLRIPAHWSADEALSVAYFLENIIEAIWLAHGTRISEELQVSFVHGSLSAFPCPPDDHDPDLS